jgi:hypothetical protein
LTPDVRALLDPKNSGGPLPVYAHHLKMYQAREIYSQYIQFTSALAISAKIPQETVILRTALHIHSEIQWWAHQRSGRKFGMTDEQVRSILAGPEAPGLDSIDAALLRAVDEMQRDVMISAATWSTLSKRYNTQQLMDIAFTTTGYRFIAMGQNAIGLRVGQHPVDIPPVWLESGARGLPNR